VSPIDRTDARSVKGSENGQPRHPPLTGPLTIVFFGINACRIKLREASPLERTVHLRPTTEVRSRDAFDDRGPLSTAEGE
jgi:hypothetical protein